MTVNEFTPDGTLDIKRIDVFDASGKLKAEYWADFWVVHVQDQGRTIKLFAHGDGAAFKDLRNTSLGNDLMHAQGRLDDYVQRFRDGTLGDDDPISTQSVGSD